jgi:UDP-N-acetylglucosamine 3-dehydrogenase
MRIGILGTGFGKQHAKIWASLPDVEVVGIVGRDAQKTQQVAQELGIPGDTDPLMLIARPDVDLIDCCYPSALHAEYACLALQHGKHVFCETPVAYTLADAERMAQAAQAAQKVVLVGLFDRFVGEYKYIAEAVHTGQLGTPQAAVANRRTPPIWGNLAENIVPNLMIHDLDYLVWLFGMPRAVTAQGVPNPQTGWDLVFITLEYAHQCAVLEGNGLMPLSFPFSTSLRVVGTTGAFDLTWRWVEDHPESEVLYYPQTGKAERMLIPGTDPYVAECAYVLDCLRGKADPALLSITTACDSLRVACAAQTSLAQQGQRIII